MSTEIVWGETLQSLESKPLELKAFAKSTFLSQGFLHKYDQGVEEALGHFFDEKVRELFRRIMMFFQEKLPGLKAPKDPFSPACLVLPAAFVRCLLYLSHCFVTLTNQLLSWPHTCVCTLLGVKVLHPGT